MEEKGKLQQPPRNERSRILVVLQDYRRSYSRSSLTTSNFYSTSCWSWTAGSGGMKKVPTVTPLPILLTRCYLAWSHEWSFDMRSSLSACVHFFQHLQFGRRPLYSRNCILEEIYLITRKENNTTLPSLLWASRSLDEKTKLKVWAHWDGPFLKGICFPDGSPLVCTRETPPRKQDREKLWRIWEWWALMTAVHIQMIFQEDANFVLFKTEHLMINLVVGTLYSS